jgi:Uma2 family endonuclease
MTLADYFATPETVLPRELAFGRMKVADAPLVPHQRAVGQLFLALSAHLAETRLGTVWLSPIDVVLDRERALVVQPDLFVVSSERESIIKDRLYGAPDLMIEVLSPDARIGSIVERLGWFARYGVRECWLVHLFDRRVEVVRLGEGRIESRISFEAHDPIRSSVLERFDRTLESILGW